MKTTIYGKMNQFREMNVGRHKATAKPQPRAQRLAQRWDKEAGYLPSADKKRLRRGVEHRAVPSEHAAGLHCRFCNPSHPMALLPPPPALPLPPHQHRHLLSPRHRLCGWLGARVRYGTQTVQQCGYISTTAHFPPHSSRSPNSAQHPTSYYLCRSIRGSWSYRLPHTPPHHHTPAYLTRSRTGCCCLPTEPTAYPH